MIILGLTGSIGMGKSTSAGMFRDLGIPVHDADETVHRLYASEAVPLIEAEFPGTTNNSGVDRSALAEAVVGKPDRLKALESIVHPLVRKAEEGAIENARNANRRIIVLDIPLLFETNGQSRCDAVVVVSADAEVQRERVLARPGMTEEKFEGLLARQWPDAKKRAHAHFLVDTGHGFDSGRRQVCDIVRALSFVRG